MHFLADSAVSQQQLSTVKTSEFLKMIHFIYVANIPLDDRLKLFNGLSMVSALSQHCLSIVSAVL